MQNDKPCTKDVDHVMEVIGVGDAVERCAASKEEEEKLGYGAETVLPCQLLL
jgi:hypothetical protein